MTNRTLLSVAALAMLFGFATSNTSHAELVAHWPLDGIEDGRAVELVNGLDMEAFNIEPDLDVVEGKIGNAISFSNEFQTLLSRIHEPDDPLPIQKHPEFTISMWAKVKGTGQNDLRLLSEGSTLDNNPLFNIGTKNDGQDDSLDIFIRNGGSTGHQFTNAMPFDDEWSHIGWTFSEGVHRIYIDGVFDRSVDWPSFTETDPFPLDNTSIGGIQRGSPSHWVTGLIDDVAMWNEVLPAISINLLAAEAVTPETALDILFGDFNFDSEINDADYNILVGNFRDPGGYEQGDINGDGTIDLADFGQFLAAAEAVGAAVPQTVPEPLGPLSLGLAILLSGLLRKRGIPRG